MKFQNFSHPPFPNILVAPLYLVLSRSLGVYDYGNEYEGRSFGSIPTMAAQRKGIFDSIESYLNGFGGT